MYLLLQTRIETDYDDTRVYVTPMMVSTDVEYLKSLVPEVKEWRFIDYYNENVQPYGTNLPYWHGKAPDTYITETMYDIVNIPYHSEPLDIEYD